MDRALKYDGAVHQESNGDGTLSAAARHLLGVADERAAIAQRLCLSAQVFREPRPTTAHYPVAPSLHHSALFICVNLRSSAVEFLLRVHSRLRNNCPTR
jgi:hypothetical protein